MSATTRAGLAALLVMGAACQPTPAKAPSTGMSEPPSAALSAAGQAAAWAVDSAWARAANAGDGAAVAALYTADATVMPPSDSSRHGPGVAAYWTGFFQQASVRIALNTASVEGRGDLAVVAGNYDLAMTPKTAGAKPLPVEHGKYLEVLQKQPDGSWKIARDIWNTDTPPAR